MTHAHNDTHRHSRGLREKRTAAFSRNITKYWAVASFPKDWHYLYFHNCWIFNKSVPPFSFSEVTMSCLPVEVQTVPFIWLQWTGWGDTASKGSRVSCWLLLELIVPASRHGEWTQNNVWRASKPQVKVLQNVAVRGFGIVCLCVCVHRVGGIINAHKLDLKWQRLWIF